MQIIIKNKDTLLCDEFEFKCSIGKKGFTSSKIEGDKKTPKGTYTLGPLFYRKDKIKTPITKLKKKIKHEKMYRSDSKYNIIIPIHYNAFNTKKNKGSAIFLHLTNNYKRTLGCIALKEKDMLILLRLINKKTKIKIL